MYFLFYLHHICIMNLENFDWGKTSEEFKKLSINEHFERKIYQRHFNVDSGDIIVDIGSSVGDFIWSILEKNPKHIWVVEPIKDNFISLKKNLMGQPVSFTYAAISENKKIEILWDHNISYPPTKSFAEFLNENQIDKIDFFKGDCEGCEYDIFSDENIDFLIGKKSKIVFEFHLENPIQKAKFRYFRDKHIKKFKKVFINSVDGVDIGWDLWNDHFLNYYTQVLIYIDNR